MRHEYNILGLQELSTVKDVKLTTHLHPVAKSGMLELYRLSSIRLHGVMINY
jgi:hypothetical protein